MIGHVSNKKDDIHGQMVFHPALPGQQGVLSPSGFDEIFYAKVTPQGKFELQTVKNGLYFASSQLRAPDGCPPEYNALWANA
jgi:hypothetical protein